jgi:hypothetical protein
MEWVKPPDPLFLGTSAGTRVLSRQACLPSRSLWVFLRTRVDLQSLLSVPPGFSRACAAGLFCLRAALTSVLCPGFPAGEFCAPLPSAALGGSPSADLVHSSSDWFSDLALSCPALSGSQTLCCHVQQVRQITQTQTQLSGGSRNSVGVVLSGSVQEMCGGVRVVCRNLATSVLSVRAVPGI